MRKESSKFRVQSSEFNKNTYIGSSKPFKCRISVARFIGHPHQRGPFHRPSAFRNSAGFSYVALLVVIAIMGISLGAAGKYWQNVMLREKEEELIFRGNQYRQAIEQYYRAVPGKLQYPPSIDDLLTDNRTAAGKRHLRQKYTDPMTGEDFEIVTAQTASGAVRALAPQSTAVPGIIGVHSKSEKEPLKKDNFQPSNENLAGKTKYSEWLFVAFTGTTPPAPGPPPIPDQQRRPPFRPPQQ